MGVWAIDCEERLQRASLLILAGVIFDRWYPVKRLLSKQWICPEVGSVGRDIRLEAKCQCFCQRAPHLPLGNESNTNFTFSTTINPAVVQPRTLIQSGFANRPIFRLSLVNRISGITAKLSCNERITWLQSRRSVVFPSPNIAITKTAGVIAIKRVVNRRNQGASRMLMKPSMTI